MHLHHRTKRDLRYEPGSGKTPMTWLAGVFRSVNNGRVRDMSLPRRIDLFVPNFIGAPDDLKISVIDTKGVDDVAIREDLDTRLRDARTTVVLCTHFNDAPSQTVRIILEHMRETFGDILGRDKASILVLPRSGEAMSMKDDDGEFPVDDADGYELKEDQIRRTAGGEDDYLANMPICFFNVEADDPDKVRSAIFEQVLGVRRSAVDRARNLCIAIGDLIKNHEVQAANAAVEEVANRLRTFLDSHRTLGARKRDAYVEALKTVDQVRYAATLWASARRNGQYSGLSIGHQTGIGAAQAGLARSRNWFVGIRMQLKTLKADPELVPARTTLEEIEAGVGSSRGEFVEALHTAGIEVYREPLKQSSDLWMKCAAEWGQGPGFKDRVRGHLEQWFEEHSNLRDKLETVSCVLWEEKVIKPLMRLVEEQSGDALESSPEPRVRESPSAARTA